MKKSTLILLSTLLIFSGCKKKDEIQPIDMTGKNYSADTKFRSLPVILQLNFKSDGTVTLLAFPDLNTVNILRYEISDRLAENTKLHIYGEITKGLYADDLVTGTKIDWNTSIGRLKYNSNIEGFRINNYHFSAD